MEILYELNCENCGAEYEILFNEEQDANTPAFCPFCGSDVDTSDIDEEDEDWDLDDEDIDFGENNK
jgi:rRNA maturation endonuclease Nob1